MFQCSGEAKFACDVFNGPRAVHVALVLSDVCRADLQDFDATEALVRIKHSTVRYAQYL